LSRLPDTVRTALREALAEHGFESEIVRTRPVSGGCINHGLRLETPTRDWFLKWNAEVPPDFFPSEVKGLRALAASDTLRVPEPLATGGGTGVPAWLLLEWVEPGRPEPDHDERLGRGLAQLHASPAGPGIDGGMGWPHPGWIGSLPQDNTPTGDWAAFWRDRRLQPQGRLARDAGLLAGNDAHLLDRLLGCVEDALPGTEDYGPHLLHGDLWGGNAYADADGRPVLVDPATYRGHGEVDLAMMELFGGFGAGVRDAYTDLQPVPEAYAAYRRDLYQLYYLLVHLNLFGPSYLAGTRSAARRVVAAMG